MNNHNSFNHHVKSRSEVGKFFLIVDFFELKSQEETELVVRHQLIDDNQGKTVSSFYYYLNITILLPSQLLFII